MIRSFIALLLLFTLGCASKSISLFNGKDLTGWTTHTTATKSANPNIFLVENGNLLIHGGDGTRAYYGAVYTDKSYENYTLTLEYLFPGPAHGDRKNNARDSGILLHCTGQPAGMTWQASIEANIMEGDTGSFWVVGNRKTTWSVDDAGNPITLAITVEAEKRSNNEWYYKPGAPAARFEGKDKFVNPIYKETIATDTLGYRGPNDFASPPGQWTKVQCICRGDTIEVYVNGKLANKATQTSLTRGRIGLQVEAADILYRNIRLTPL